MSAPLFGITESWTEPLIVQLLIDGAAFDATGMTITSVVRDRHQQLVTVTTAWSTAATSQASLSPGADTFEADHGPYTLKYRVVDGAGKVAYFPPTEPARIDVWVD